MAKLRFFYICAAKSTKKKYAKWHIQDWEYGFSEALKLGEEYVYNSFVKVCPQKLSYVQEVFPDGLRTIYHHSWFTLSAMVTYDESGASRFPAAVARLSELGYLELVLDMLEQAKQAGFTVSTQYRL